MNLISNGDIISATEITKKIDNLNLKGKSLKAIMKRNNN
jgi:hypothetical protein